MVYPQIYLQYLYMHVNNIVSLLLQKVLESGSDILDRIL